MRTSRTIDHLSSWNIWFTIYVWNNDMFVNTYGLSGCFSKGWLDYIF